MSSICRNWIRWRRRCHVRPDDNRIGQQNGRRAGRSDRDAAELLDPRRAHQDDSVRAADAVRLSARIDRQRVAATCCEATRWSSHWSTSVTSQQATTGRAQSNNGRYRLYIEMTTTMIIINCYLYTNTEHRAGQREFSLSWQGIRGAIAPHSQNFSLSEKFYSCRKILVHNAKGAENPNFGEI